MAFYKHFNIKGKIMKTIVLFVVIAIFTFGSVNAQEKKNVELGVNFGLNISNVSDIDSYDATSSKISYNIGASGEYYFSNRWGLKAKLIYDRKGWADGFIYDWDIDLFAENVDFRLNYLTIPIMVNWHFGSTRKWYLNFGPYVGFLVNATESWGDSDLNDSFESVDFGLSYGIGYKFPLNDTTKLFVEYDAQSGLSEIFKFSELETIRNGRSSFNIGALFNIN